MKKILSLISLFVFILLINCSSDTEREEDIEENLTLSIEKLLFPESGGTQTIQITSNTEWELDINETWCVADNNSGQKNANVKITADANDGEDIRKSEITIRTKSGKTEVKLAVEQQTMTIGVPLMTINIAGGQAILDKVNYLKGTIKIESKTTEGRILETLFETAMGKDGIRGRGNSTWGMEKKPYKIKLDKSIQVLDMPANKHWVLLANYADKTLMRNELAFEISRRMGYTYTPRLRFVDLVLNGKYEGNYMLCEHVRIAPDRVNITELTPNASNISGGYLLEIDERQDDNEIEYFHTKGDREIGYEGIIVAINEPQKKEITDKQKTYVVEHFQKIEDALYGKLGDPVTELPKYLDIRTFIDNFLVNEISKNVDGNLRLSTKMYKKINDDKLYFGPVWDYDLAFGNADYDGGDKTTGWISRNVRWYKAFFEIQDFKDRTAERWSELRNGTLSTGNLHAFIDELAANLDQSQKANFEVWNILNKKVWPNPVATGSYKGEINYLKDFLSSRAIWIDKNIDQ